MAAGLKAVAMLAAGYLCACFVAVVVVRVASPGLIGDNDLPIAVALTVELAFPGFVALRLALWVAGVHAIGVFATAGALNAILALVLLQRSLEANWVLSGAGFVAGAVYHVVEKAIFGRIMMRQEASAP